TSGDSTSRSSALKSGVSVKWTCVDSLSGPVADVVTDLRTVEGTANASGTCTDKAGNFASATREVKIDKTDPTITFDSQTPVANVDGWNKTDVTVKWNCADSLSGPVADFVTDLRTLEGTANASGTCTDKAGNFASATREVKIDKTDPTITASATVTGGGAYTSGDWTNKTVTVHFSCSDALSGIAVGACPGDVVVSANTLAAG